MKKKLLIFGLVAALLITVFTGCGGTGNGGEEENVTINLEQLCQDVRDACQLPIP